MSTEPVRVKTGIVSAQVALNAATATLVMASDAGETTFKNLTRGFVDIQNTDTSIIIYIGPLGVTALTGYPIPPGAAMTFGGAGRVFVGDIYAIAASGAPVVATLTY